MKYLAFADFAIPYDFLAYRHDCFYLWSSIDGALNLEGVLRFLSKMVIFVFFFISHSGVWTGYFYIFATLFISFFSYYSFQKYFLKIQKRQALFIGAIFFILNPIFLGNITKTGLVLGVAMLPLAISFLSRFFRTSEMKYLIPVILACSISLVHPFIFVVNACVVFVYGVFRVLRSSSVKTSLVRLSLGLTIFLLLNSAPLFSIISTGEMQKSSVTNELGADDSQVNALLEYATTGGYLNAMIFSRNILRDFDFYPSRFAGVYAGSVLILYAIIGWYLFQKINRRNKTVSIIFASTLLILYGLTVMEAGWAHLALSALNNLPVGWIFRSPLKWQLYVPLCFMSLLAMAMNYILSTHANKRHGLFVVMAISFLGSNAYLSLDVMGKLLVPKEVAAESRYVKMDLNHKLVLLVDFDTCKSVALSKKIELREVLISSVGVQVKKISKEALSRYYTGEFNYIFSCDELSDDGLETLGKDDFHVYGVNIQRPRIFSAASLYAWTPLLAEKKIAFVKNVYGGQNNFVQHDGPTEDDRLIHVSNPFEEMDYEHGFIRSQITTAMESGPDRRNVVYKGLGMEMIQGTVSKDQLKITIDDDRGMLGINGVVQEFGDSSVADTWQTARLNFIKGVYVAYGDRIERVRKNSVYNFGKREDVGVVTVFEIIKNKITNGSFEFGSWQKNVGDCNNHDNHPIIGMTLNEQKKTDGRRSLQLEAMRHVACISTEIPVSAGKNYILSFDYQSTNAKDSRYAVVFDDPAKSSIRGSALVTTSTWQSFVRRISVPNGVTRARLYLYAAATDGQTRIINRYDDIRFGEMTKVVDITIPMTRVFDQAVVSSRAGDIITYQNPRYSFANVYGNGSFEKGPWQQKVGDCHAYDDQPALGMSLDPQEKTDGAQSLRLEATRHTACTATTVPVNSGSTYILSFNYQSPNSKQAMYYYRFNDPNKTVVSENLPIADRQWHEFSKIIETPDRASSLTLYVYAKETDGKNTTINRYDNFKLIEIPDLRDAYYFVSEPKEALVEPQATRFELISPTKKLVHIQGATTPFFLGLSESYHPQWQLEMTNDKIRGVFNSWWPFVKSDRVPDGYHYKLAGFLNSWYVDVNELCATRRLCQQNADGSYDLEMTIEFWPQRWFYLGLMISGLTLGGCLGCLVFIGIRDLRRRLTERQRL